MVKARKVQEFISERDEGIYRLTGVRMKIKVVQVQ